MEDGKIRDEVKKKKKGEFRFYLTDTNRIRIKRHIGLLRGVKNLIRLGVPMDSQDFFLKQYLSPKQLKKYLWLWYKMNKMTYSWYIKLKKRLKLKQLARKLKIQ